jgi:DNA-binding transcriptional LysR family regulator
VSVATCPGVRQGLKDGAFDVGFFLEPPSGSPSTRFAEREVVASRVPLVVFAAPEHPLTRRVAHGPVPRHALGASSLFVSDAAGDWHVLLERFFHADGVPGPRLQAMGSVEGVKRAVLADPLALGVLPGYAIAEELRGRKLVPLDVRPAPPGMSLVALLSRSRRRHPSTRELLDGIRHGFVPGSRH